MAYITKKKPSPVGDKPKEDKIEKPTSKWIQKKEGLKKDKRKTMFESFQERASEEPRRNMNIGGRANLLEEMGRIDARRHPDAADRAEKRRVIGELNRGYKKGGLIKGKPKLAKKGWN